MKKVLLLILVLFAAVLTACSQDSEKKSGSAETGEKVMKLAVATAEDRSLTKGLVKFGELVEEKTNGSIKVEVYPNNQLGGDREVFESMQMGSIEASSMSTGVIAQFLDSYNAFDLPFLFPDREIAYKVLDGEFGKKMLAELDSQNIVGVNYFENGYRHLTNDVREIKSPEDLNGLKIRTLESEIHIDIWKTLGANPTPMAYSELFSGLQQGVVEGQENPIGNVVSNKFFEVQDYITMTGHVYNASPLLFGKDFWMSLSEEEQTAIQEAADEARDYQRELNYQEDMDGIKMLEEEGITITELDDEQKEAFFNASKPVYEKYSSVIGEDIVNELLDEIKKYK